MSQERFRRVRKVGEFLAGKHPVEVSQPLRSPAIQPSVEVPVAPVFTAEPIAIEAQPAPKKRTSSPRRTQSKKGTNWAAVALAGVLVAGAGIGGYELAQKNDSNSGSRTTDIGIVSGTPKPSEAAGVKPSVEVTVKPEASAPVEPSSVPASQEPTVTDAPASVEPSTNPEQVTLIKIESAEVAAQRFGVDAYSSNPKNWEINEYGGAGLKETGKTVKVNTAGAVVEGWIKAKMVDARDALTFVADPKKVPTVEANGVTVWDFGGNDAGYAQVLEQVIAKEKIEQPDVTVIPFCTDLEPIDTNDVTVVYASSPKEAASMHGLDAYSENPANWGINEFGGAYLKENPNGKASLVRTNGTSVEGWIRPEDMLNGRNAVTIVTHPSVEETRINGGTFWEFTNADRGFQQLLGQVIAKEAIEQPEVIVIPSQNCVLTR